MFEHHTRISLHHTDAAGRLFFAWQFVLFHEAKEHFLERIGLPVGGIIDHPRLTFPVVHAEADYAVSLRAGDRVVVQLVVEKTGISSVTFGFSLLKEDGTLAGKGRTVNVLVDKQTGKPEPLPEDWRSRFA